MDRSRINRIPYIRNKKEERNEKRTELLGAFFITQFYGKIERRGCD